ncbi:MAG TPA: M20/M25/M40 family metallo-hydrolase, partial [Chloroflexia bacterium]|nr:M20/M25/M40 family metallo-hydrolase [Chloroflexia bacterium]
MSAPETAVGPLAHDLLARLVAIDSRNPVLAAGAPGERAIVEMIAGFLRDAGLEVSLVGDPNRPSVVGRLRGTGAGRSLLLNGHIDTVGFGGMADPTTPRIAEGRLYGRGAYDMKGGVAAMLAAAATLAAGPPLRGDLLVTAVADEEHASLGTQAVVTHLAAAGLTAHGAIVTEPTDLDVCIAHKGFVWATITSQGRAAHGSRRADGVDAIAHMGRVLVALEALDAELQTRPAHPLLGHASLHASLISGGTELSTYPAQCELQIERRTLPSETPDSVVTEIKAILDRCRAADAAFRAEAVLTLDRPPLETAADDLLVTALLAAAQEQGGTPTLTGATFWMDAALLGAAGIPAVAFG